MNIRVYIVSRLTDKDDVHGHIQRIIAQFFLSANNLVSYSISAIVLFVLLFLSSEINVLRVIIFFCGMALLYWITFLAVQTRYRTMIQSLWAVRNVIANRE